MSGTHHGHESCPNCKRSLTPEEVYCYFCEMDVSELKKKSQKGQGGGHNH